MSIQLLWLRRDLRLHDQPALAAALAAGGEPVPVFCLDRRLLGGRHRSAPRTQFLLECLRELDGALRERGSALQVVEGSPATELPRLARELGASAVHASEDIGPYARRRDAAVAGELRAAGADLRLHPGLFVLDDPAAPRTVEGRPYTVFTPYLRAWLREPRREPSAPPPSLPAVPQLRGGTAIPTLAQLGMRQTLSHPPAGGERAGREALERWLEHGVREYHERRELLAADTSRLSPYLHFGCVSPRELEQRLPRGRGAQEYRRQLCWRDFYAQVMRAFPGNARSEHQQRYRSGLRWRRAHGAFGAWCEGRTGYPVVDAAMRQLQAEGWIHNRGRLIAGSFLTKDLGIDWRWGERWFMSLLLDGDEASNNGNWQWIASVGVDRQPVARRLYNPTRQQARFDPDGGYVRRHVPELARVPDEYLAEPWTMPLEVQEAAGCRIGRDYPEPVVDHASARREALARFASARGGGSLP